MKEALALIYAALIAPLVDAIKENTAAISASKSSCTSAPSPTTGTEAPEPQAEAPKRGRKPADKTPPADVPAGEQVGADDIIAYAKSLDDTAKEKFKAWMSKTYGVQSVAELKAEDRPAVLKTLKDKGATDTRAQAPKAEEW